MKVADGMDSVFDQATQEEQEFQLMFDDDDTIIDYMAGVDEAGIPLTGPDFDWDSILEGVDDDWDVSDVKIPQDKDYNAEKNGDQQATPAQANGVKDAPLEKGGELGNQAMTPGSAEAHAYDDKKQIDDAIGLNDKQQVKLEDAGEGPLEDDDEAERNGETSDTAVATESAPEVTDASDVEITESVINALKNRSLDECASLESRIQKTIKAKALQEQRAYDMLVDAVLESMTVEELQSENVNDIVAERVSLAKQRLIENAECCPKCKSNPCQCDTAKLDDTITDPCDAASREGEAEVDTKNIEGVKTNVFGDALDGKADKDTIIELDDEDARDGKVSKDADEIEGVDTNVIGAAIESVLANLLEDEDTLAKLVDKAKVDNLTDIDDGDARDGDTNKDEGKDIEGVDNDVIGAAVEAAIADLLSDVGDGDDIDLESISSDDKIIPDTVREDATEDLIDDEDELDIEAIDDEDFDGQGDVADYNYDDDELIDMVASGSVDI